MRKHDLSVDHRRLIGARGRERCASGRAGGGDRARHALELADVGDRGLAPSAHARFGLAAGAISVMEREHAMAGLALKTLRRLTGGFRPPDDACGSFRALYAGLEIPELDLHRHIHLENNVLFPRAMGLESRLRSQR